ncbi:FitA-like ribbon-helix-helix domain-containing protein [Lichenibacterium dinghuense]|uniref:FitA-like ribbon-helix-helix domain-containing protein n=1 Tax=Lichenibacterium dinghuense TaxID=2895977 RepID=UPI001F20DAA3|nr:plasmid stability protein [Lichenibacterium sp. 6Y81]
MNVDQLSKLPGNAVTVRGLSPELKARLRVRAAHNARSMEAEARAILEAALSAPDDESTDLGAFARGLFAPLGGVDLELPARSAPRQPPQLSDADDVTTETTDASTVVASPAPEPVIDPPITPAPTSPRKRRQ